jgi:hypothetical protein
MLDRHTNEVHNLAILTANRAANRGANQGANNQMIVNTTLGCPGAPGQALKARMGNSRTSLHDGRSIPKWLAVRNGHRELQRVSNLGGKRRQSAVGKRDNKILLGLRYRAI